MKYSFLLALMSLICSTVFSQAASKKATVAASVKSIADFGAKANDLKDDTWAFIKAGKYFSNVWDINGVPLPKGKLNFSYTKNAAKLIIPSGTYMVGKQIDVPITGLVTTYGQLFGYKAANAPIIVPPNSAGKYGLEILTFSNDLHTIDGLSVTGVGKTKPVVKYNDGLHIGYINSENKSQFMQATAYNASYVVTIGNFISALSCKNLLVSNIEIDGNNIPDFKGGKTIYHGGFGNDKIQVGGSGVYLYNTKNVSLQNLNIHHMTIDGVIYQDNYRDTLKFKNQLASNLEIDNVICNYNRRQGFSWTGGKNIKVSNSKFNNTSMHTPERASGNPGAGLDIEPELDAYGEPLLCLDGKFINCEFINNLGCALVNDMTGFRTHNVSFDSCTFHDVDTYAVWVKGKKITFNNCKIWGGFVYGNDGENADNATVFNNCDFADEEVKTRPGVYNIGYALVESWQAAKHTKFNNCSFRTIHPKQRLLAMYTPSIKEAEFARFSNCSFTVGNVSNGENIMFGCYFDQNTSFISNNKNDEEVIYLNGFIVAGSSNSRLPYKFNSSGKILFSIANGNGLQSTQFVIGRSPGKSNALDGYVDFAIGNNSCLNGSWNQLVDIGKNAKFINKAGGQIAFLSATINNSGNIILENGSYTAFFNPVSLNTSATGSPKFVYHKDAKMAVSPIWAEKLKGLGSARKLSSTIVNKHTKIEGGNPDQPLFKVN